MRRMRDKNLQNRRREVAAFCIADAFLAHATRRSALCRVNRKIDRRIAGTSLWVRGFPLEARIYPELSYMPEERDARHRFARRRERGASST
jgi:hypothetical protein